MLRYATLVGLTAAALTAQSPLTTTYAGGNGLGAASTIYFNLVLNAPLTFMQIDVNSSSVAGTTGSLDVRWTANTYVGNATNATAWTLGGSGPLTAAGPAVPTPCTLTPFTLPPGNYGFAVTFNGIGQSYTNGTGTTTPGGGSNQTWTTNEMTMLCGASSGGAPGTAICCEPRVFNGSIYYAVGGAGTVATRTNYGTGCYQRVGSVYEYFATSAAFDLSNSSISMLPSGNGGYVVLPGITTYVAPTVAATVVALTDDSESPVNLSSPFPHAGGTTSSLTVCSNGYVSIASGNGTAYTPVVATMLAAPQTGWWNWHDYNPAATGGGRVKFEQAAGIAYITWDGVYDFTGTTAANANRFQFQFDTTSGAVHLVFQTMSALGNPRLVGYSPAGPSIDPGSQDLSVLLPSTILLAINENPLALTASARPLIGTTINLVTANQTGMNVGVNFLSLAQIPAPGFDLGVIGAPGCPALIDVNQSLGNVISNLGLPGTSMSVSIPIPNSNQLLGAQVFSQSVWIDVTANAFGALTSNGVALVLGNV
ncbi:MAG: hypothetical protein ABIP94_19775 [Planctomycetota bacterium]